MSKFNKLFNSILTDMNINLIKETVCKPDTMLNQTQLNAKKIPDERKAQVVVKQDGNTTGIVYNVDSDSSAKYMVDNIKQNGGDAKVIPGSGITKENALNDVLNANDVEDDFAIPTEIQLTQAQQEQFQDFYDEGRTIGIDAVTAYLQAHPEYVGQDFYFQEATQDEYFQEYAFVKMAQSGTMI